MIPENKTYCLHVIGKRDIQALQVKCSNVDRQCTWEGTVATLEEHLFTCDYSLVSCPHFCTEASLMKKDLQTHLQESCIYRDHTCQYCGIKGTFFEITELHDSDCKRKPISCPNPNCGEVLEQCGVKRHLEACEHTKLPCKYAKLGCSEVMKRKDMAEHEEDDKLHLRMALETVAILKDSTLKESTPVLGAGKCFTFKVSNCQALKEKDFKSPHFTLTRMDTSWLSSCPPTTHISPSA